MIKCLITRPNHDKVTSYLFQWSKEIINFKYPAEIQFLDLPAKKANESKVESYLKKQCPKIVLFNGHGDDNTICWFKDEPLIETGKNDELLKGKIIYSLSCSSARKLGESSINKGADAFVGYRNSFMLFTDADSEAAPLKDSIAASFLKPSNKLSISLLKGNTAQEASNKSKEEFRKEIKKFLSSKAIDGSGRIASALFWDMSSQAVIGNQEARI